MTDINQVRINELARELEVKAKAIIDLLPGFGVTEKKTHSSSIPADVAVKVRATIQGQVQAEADAEAKAKSDKESKDAAAKAALRKPVAPPAPLHQLPRQSRLSRLHQSRRHPLRKRRQLQHQCIRPLLPHRRPCLRPRRLPQSRRATAGTSAGSAACCR